MYDITRDGKQWTTSLNVAEVFGKPHKDVLKAIDNLECSQEFARRNFAPGGYADKNNQMRKMYDITRDGKQWTTSLNVAEVFNKNHFDVLKAIENLECSQEFAQRNCNFSITPIKLKHKYYSML